MSKLLTTLYVAGALSNAAYSACTLYLAYVFKTAGTASFYGRVLTQGDICANLFCMLFTNLVFIRITCLVKQELNKKKENENERY